MSGMYTRLVAGALFPLQEGLKGHCSVRVRRELERSQYWAEERLHSARLERLRGLLAEAQKRSPYYRDRFAALGFDAASDLRSLADLQHLPLLDKATIRAHADTIRSTAAGPLQRMTTGGSSGEPLTFYVGRERTSHDVAAKWRATRWWGVDVGDREMVIWGSPIELQAQDRVRALRDRLLRTELLPAFDLAAPQLDRYLQRILKRRPRMLFGYPSALAYLARHAREQGLRMDRAGVQVAFVTSERLYDEQRADIAQVFGCAVANGYGGRDAGFVAHECPAGNMHISAEDIVVETVDARGMQTPPGVPGEIVVTHLCTRAFPFIRYRTGDIGALSQARCPCGRTLPLLQEIQGRSTDFVVAQDGTVLHGLALIYVLRDIPQVRVFRVEQESLSLTRVLLVLDAPLDDGLRNRVVQGFRARLGPQVQVEVRQVAAIAPERSGKFRYVVSKLAEGT
ncbi:MAG TPA: phenylacetate--CoA ligase family protein [Telluria sp.]|nr:phenylacetate--CoA ligase family protein [Telluria sp.]